MGLKVLSVILAVFTWLIMVNVSNPIITTTVEVPVEMINEEVLRKANLTYEITGKNTVTVSCKVRTRDSYRISASDFYAYADLAELYDVTGSIPVKLETANRAVKALIEGELSASPNVVRVQTENLQRKRFDLRLDLEGEAEEGFTVGKVSLNPEYVFLTAAESVVGQISFLGVELNIEGANSDLEGEAEVKFYDANGNELKNLKSSEDIELSLEKVNYQVSILKVKNLALDFQVEGEVAEGYRYTGVECDIRTISVQGLKSALASVTTLTIPGELLNVEGAVSDVEVKVDLKTLLPDNITIVGEGEAIASVILKVEKLVNREMEYDLDQVELVGAREKYKYTFQDETIRIQIRGLAEDLDMLQTADIHASVNVMNLEPGIHNVVLDIGIDDGFKVVTYEVPKLMVLAEGMEPGDLESSTPPESAETEETEPEATEAGD